MTLARAAFFWALIAAFFLGVVWLLGDVLLPFVLGITIAYLLGPVANRLEARGLPRWGAAALILGVFFLLVGGFLALVGPLLFQEALRLARDLPGLIEQAKDAITPYAGWIHARLGAPDAQKVQDTLGEHMGSALNFSGALLTGLQAGGQALIAFVSLLVVMPVVAFFMIKEWNDITRWVRDLLPRRHEATILDLLGRIDVRLAGFIRGQVMVCVSLGILYGLALSIAGLDYGLVIGLGAGILSIIPLVGSTAGLLAGIILAWIQTQDPAYVAMIAAIFGAGQFIEGNILTPRLVGQSAGLHPLWILLALMAGGSLFGLTGMLLAVPVAIVVAVLGGFALTLYKTSAFYGAAPRTGTSSDADFSSDTP